jgi:RNA 2',3'-cyclic 3'-phosphodiesterase
VPIAEPALREAQRLQASLGERVGGVRWARPETLHLTVHFFGNVDDLRAATAVDAVVPVASDMPRFEVELGHLGAFPPHGTPRVLWLGPSHDVAPLTALALECATVLRDAGFDVEARPYHPHCTLGRPRWSWTDDARVAWASVMAEPAAVMRFTATRLVLYESRPAPGGAVYTERSVLPFVAR